jgi:hypothetical protein
MTRRSVLLSAGAAAAVMTVSPSLSLAANAAAAISPTEGTKTMAYVTTKDGVEIFYKDWGPKGAQPIVFHHGCATPHDVHAPFDLSVSLGTVLVPPPSTKPVQVAT